MNEAFYILLPHVPLLSRHTSLILLTFWLSSQQNFTYIKTKFACTQNKTQHWFPSHGVVSTIKDWKRSVFNANLLRVVLEFPHFIFYTLFHLICFTLPKILTRFYWPIFRTKAQTRSPWTQAHHHHRPQERGDCPRRHGQAVHLWQRGRDGNLHPGHHIRKVIIMIL